MFSIEVRNNSICVGLATLLVVFTAITSLGFSTRAQAQLGTVHERPKDISPSVEAAVVVAAFGAYGWVANKTYDLGKEVGRATALEGADSKRGGMGSRLVLDHRHELLLD
jgi:hypothetical protein